MRYNMLNKVFIFCPVILMCGMSVWIAFAKYQIPILEQKLSNLELEIKKEKIKGQQINSSLDTLLSNFVTDSSGVFILQKSKLDAIVLQMINGSKLLFYTKNGDTILINSTLVVTRRDSLGSWRVKSRLHPKLKADLIYEDIQFNPGALQQEVTILTNRQINVTDVEKGKLYLSFLGESDNLVYVDVVIRFNWITVTRNKNEMRNFAKYVYLAQIGIAKDVITEIDLSKSKFVEINYK